MDYAPTIQKNRTYSILEILFIVILACVPLFVSFPYRVNIFLSWEGAYRMSHGELPFRDFGTPLGGMYWTIPAIFFKLFGTKMITLVKAQVFINIISGLAFRSILKSCKVEPGIKLVSVFLYCISFSFFNFWPWYNHTVIVYEFIALAFLLKFITGERKRFSIVWLLLAALFTCFSFMTKQDGGGMAFGAGLVLLIYSAWTEKKWWPVPVFIAAFTGILFIIIAIFMGTGFSYWFNHGQAPHTARISIGEILDEFFVASAWIKFYLFLTAVILLIRFRNWQGFLRQKKELLFPLLTLCILGEAAVFQVTSYTPPDNNIFFHSFAFAFILGSLASLSKMNFNKPKVIVLCMAGMLVWWSHVYWKYIQRFAERAFPSNVAKVSPTGENVVNRKTYMINYDTTNIPMSQWVFSGLKSFDKIYMPQPTADGIHRLLNSDLVKQANGNLKVLNMSELTPLAVEMPYKLERNPEYPLWFHLGVAMFNKQAEMFEKRIAAKEYDLVLFEYVPNLNNFYPFRVRDSLRNNYKLVDSFMAPRREDTPGVIEIYAR